MKYWALLAFIVVGCGGPTGAVKTVLPAERVSVGGKELILEEATTPGEWEAGLMDRGSLGADQGMILAYYTPRERSVSGHDVRFALEAIFLDHWGKIVGISQVRAFEDAPTPSFDAQYVVELNQGTGESLGLKVGDQFPLPPKVIPPPLPTTRMNIGGRIFTLEIATTDGEQELGLMCRPSLGADHGMIFVFPEEETLAFWNHDVSFPLDVLFLDGSGKIVGICHMNAEDDTNTPDYTMKYAFELNAGTADKLHLHAGEILPVPNELTGQ